MPTSSSARPHSTCTTSPANTTSSMRAWARLISPATARAPRLGLYSFDDHGVHFIGLVNVVDLKAGGLGSGTGAARVARRRHQGQVEFDADRGVRPYPAVDSLCRLGLGHRRRPAGARYVEALRLGDRAQRPY